ncbi:MAG: AAA family ATPase, partial [Proteobacteria bacterium]|nr:AAA family ATPase [Pseudomonadota bacterium]
MSDLFTADKAFAPLADRMRPRQIDQVVGQSHILGAGKPLSQAIESNKLHSMLFWGPPGTGKTTIARLIAEYSDARFLTISAVLSGVKEIREAIELARQHQGRTVLFVDEVHRFNKSQQDAFLPFIEDGTLLFVGATTENPSFELNNALLSRTRTYVLKPISTDDLDKVLHRALEDKRDGLGNLGLSIDDDARQMLVNAADGDARRALTFLEIASDLVETKNIDSRLVGEVVAQGLRRFDKKGDFLAFEGVMQETLRTRPMRVCAYCLLSNHWHFVLWPENDGDLPAFMQQMTNTHVKRWQEHRHETGYGHLYQGRYNRFRSKRRVDRYVRLRRGEVVHLGKRIVVGPHQVGYVNPLANSRRGKQRQTPTGV